MRQTAYAPVDWQATPRPTQTVTVRFRRVQIIAFALLAGFFGGIGAIILFSGHGLSVRRFLVPGIGFALVALVGFLLYNSRQKAAREFNADGVSRGDGRHFDWNGFRGVNVITRRRAPSATPLIWRVELVFDGGETAWIIPQQVKNFDEVYGLLSTLPRARPAAGKSPIAPAS